MPRVPAIVGLVAGLIGCSGQSALQEPREPPAGLTYASASDDCAPWDGHAVSVLLSARPGTDTGGIDATDRPLVRVSVYPRSPMSGDQQFSWPHDPEQASGVRCLAAADCEGADRGTVVINSALPDSVVVGSIDLHFADGSTVKGGFHARWIQRRILCG